MIERYKDHQPQIEPNAFIHPQATVIGEVQIGAESSVWPGAVLRGDVAGIRIGVHSNIQDCAVIHCSTQIPTTVGDGVTVGHGAILHSCTIESGALIGMGAIVLDGAVVEKDAMVAAGALVPPGGRIPSGQLAMGSPARVFRELKPEEIESNRANANEYVYLANQHLESGNDRRPYSW